MPESIGFIGLGIMGQPMALNLAQGRPQAGGLQSHAGEDRSPGGGGRARGRLAR